MNQNCSIKHVALKFPDEKQADVFFIDILGLKVNKKFSLEPSLVNNIFGIKDKVNVKVYSNDNSYFEIFFSEIKNNKTYEHICIEISDKKQLIENCKKNKIKPITVKKGEKTLLFIRDFAGNLYEIKEKKSI